MQIGDKIPEFSLLDQNGVKRSNKELKKEPMEVALKNNPEAQALNSDWTFKI